MLELGLALTNHLSPGDWNEAHPFVRYEEQRTVAGAYLNSESGLSLFVGGIFRHNQYFAEIGIVTGYSGADILPFGRAGIESENTRYFIAPSLVDGELGVVFGVEIFTN